MSKRRFRIVALAICCAALACALAAQEVSAQRPKDPRNQTITVPPPTDKGEWSGTWFYVNRDARFALWFREDKKGRPELRLQFFGMQNAESFITDWQGHADYYVRDVPATFSLELTERDSKVIKGEWRWFVDAGRSARTENATVTLHRTGDGRRLVLVFEDLDLVQRRGDDVHRVNTRLSYTFAKVSKRLVNWEELPF